MGSAEIANEQLLQKVFISGEALRALSLHGVGLIASVFENLASKAPNLRILRLGSIIGQRNLLSPHQYDMLLQFLSSSRLREIAFSDFKQDLPWHELISSNGPYLRQLTIHTRPCSDEVDQALGAAACESLPAHLRWKLKLGFSSDDLLCLSSACPDIERLGFDVVHGQSLQQAREEILVGLVTFRRVRHLHLFSHIHEVRQSCEMPLVSSLELVSFFNDLMRQKQGTVLETLMYHDYELEWCKVWAMGENKTLIAYRNKHGMTEIQELYEGTRLLWTRRKPLEEPFDRFSQWEFPG
ncbi:MAG: hypothetical protein Q9181_006804 [Wetmoreana brouardii]